MSLSISISSISQSSFTARVSTSGSVAMQHNWYLDGDLYTTVQTSAGQRSSSCTFRGLQAGTYYSVRVAVYAFNPWRQLDSGSTSAKTEDAPMIAETYYAKVILNGNGGRLPSGSSTFEKFTGWGTSWSGSADINISFYDPGFTKTGSSLIGWSRSSSATRPTYDPSDSISITSSKTSESRAESVTLYAVWGSNRPQNWYWQSTVAKGSSFGLTASEWNGFISRVQEFAKYKGTSLSNTYISNGRASKGSKMLASQANSVRSLVNQLSPPTQVPSAVNSGNPITASFVNGLKNSLNSIQ